MQTLLPLKHFKYAVDLQPIEVKNRNLLSVGIFNEHITSAADFSKLYEKLHNISIEKHKPSISKYLTFSEDIKNENQNDKLCTQICIYLKAPSKHKKSTIQLNSCRVNNGLLMKKNYM